MVKILLTHKIILHILPQQKGSSYQQNISKKGGSIMSRSFLWKSLIVVFGCAIIAFAAAVGSVNAASLGQELSNPQIRDAEDDYGG